MTLEKHKIPGTDLELSDEEIEAVVEFNEKIKEDSRERDIFDTSSFEDDNGFLPVPEGIFLNKKKVE